METSHTDDDIYAIYGVEEVPKARTLVDILTVTVHNHPDATALEGTNETLTYRELVDRINNEVDRLAELGIGKGDRIGIRVPSGTTDLYIAILSTICAGAAYVPVDWDDPDSRANTVWEEAQVAAVYGQDLSIVQHGPQREPITPSSPELTDHAWIIFTSGSTGKPKGVAVSHRSAAALVDAESRMYLVDQPLGPSDRVMAGLSVAFDASCEEMWLAWRYGATLVAAPRDIVRSADALGQWITDHRISTVSTVPTLASFWTTESLSNVRLLIFGGEALPKELINRLATPGREVWNTYGPTETTVICSGELVQPLNADEPVRIGRATPGWQLAVVNPETEEPVRWGESGELVVAGVGLGRYLDPKKDAEAYAPIPSLNWDRAYRTGDLVIAEKAGLIFAGRTDDQIKFGGRRMELGEIDRALAGTPGVSAAAAAKQKTPAGSDVIVGYIVAESEINLSEARSYLSKVLPGGIAPTLCVVDELPMKTSGKVDRSALPWPLPDSGETTAALPEELHWLAHKWADQLGQVPMEPDSNFFELGGSSVAIAKLAVELRHFHPALDIGNLYKNPTLSEMAAYIATLNEAQEKRPTPRKIPWWSGVFQFLVVCAIYAVNALRYIVGSLIVVWALRFFFDAAWVPEIPLWPLLASWLILFSTAGKMLQATIVVRLLTMGVRPGKHLRGGWTHMRVWAADRFLTYLKLESLLGTPGAPLLYRLFGCTVGRGVALASMPPVSGLLSIGENSCLEQEVDVNGHWIEGDTFHIGRITIGDQVRVGLRTFVAPDATIGDGAEILPGSCVTGSVPNGQLYGGSPLIHRGKADETWPAQSPADSAAAGKVHITNGVQLKALYLSGQAWMTLLPIISILPGTAMVLPRVITHSHYEEVFPILAAWVPVFTLLTVVTWLGLVIFSIRFCALFIKPGFFPQESATGWAVWLTHTLLQKTLTSTYFMYAGWLTPAFLRLLGARVGNSTEISTVETIPHLTSIGNRCFLADHSLCASVRYRSGWVHIGTTVIGDGSFVGNSGIVGIDHDLPEDSLIAVLASTPERPGRGTSWLGRTTQQIPRTHVDADKKQTFNPSNYLKVARALVEAFRFLPVLAVAYLDLFIVWVGTIIYMHYGLGWSGLRAVAMWATPIVLLAGIAASILPIIAKWLLVGRFKPGDHTLYSSFVWRGELVDNFTEILAVPSLIRMSLGSPMFNLWARLMGSSIGRSVWCETWWLPEFDLIRVEDRATINRGTVLQTHLFHDRVMALEPVVAESGSTLGPNSFMLPGSSLGERTTVLPGSLVLRQDGIPADSVWTGNPVAFVNDPKLTAESTPKN